MSVAQQLWIEAHPYLQKVAEFQRTINKAFAGVTPGAVSMPDWNRTAEQYDEGVPLLENTGAALSHTSAAGNLLLAGTERLLQESLPQPVVKAAKQLLEHLKISEENRKAAINWVQTGDPEKAPVPVGGLLRVLGWTAITRTLAPVLSRYAEWRNEDHWMRGYCPVCGSLPPVAQIAPGGTQPRMLACGCCHSSWRYKRISCPFCENDDPEQLGILNIEQEPLFRLDVCDECSGYLKTYLGEGDIELHLSDWSTLHLDAVARQQNLARKGCSLFEL
ncbi:MAG TPA: formate dehydrogenase accessory protein FdhE [Candidatus Acidoferrales bacterium]|nr:formate dehydrogenase accessory protein FdhE [Candidatus Acidoferrales bacterium]